MIVLQAILILVAIAALSAAIVAAWNTLVPPSAVRASARDFRKEVQAQREKAQKAALEVSRLDREWVGKRDGVVAEYRKNWMARLDAATKEMRAIETNLAASTNPNVANVFAQLQSNARSSTSDDRQIASVKGTLDQVVYNYWYWLDDYSRGAMQQWNQQWQSKKTAELRIKEIPIAGLRGIEQPSYAEAAVNNEREAETLRNMESDLAQREEAASLKWKSAAWRGMLSFGSFLLFVWLGGLLIETAWLAIRVADDIRRIRELSAPVADRGALLRSEPHVPIREPTVTPQIAPQTPA